MGNKTPIYALHVQSNAKIVDFAGWDMPLHYGSQLEEHHYVRRHAGMFDVSHMGVVDLKGKDVAPYLRYLLANNIDRLIDGKALYSCMLNEKGGVIDDLIVYKVNDEFFRLVVNAGTREKDIAWMQQQLGSFTVQLKERTELAIIAVQGPEVKNKLAEFLPSDAPLTDIQALKPFTFLQHHNWFIARTGYTGEDGYEIILPADEATICWQAMLSAGINPCGLGARDTLRLEAGMNLYGLDMDENSSPYEANLGWTVILDPANRDFIGREALEQQKQTGVELRLVGLVLEGPGIIRNHQKVITKDKEVGEITSGGYSPTLQKSIALARVPVEAGAMCYVEIRGKQIPAAVVKPPFVRHGKQVY